MKRLLICAIFFLGMTIVLQAKCYLRVEKSGNYDPILVSENAIAHISNFVEKIHPLPPGGISMKEGCVYNLNIKENDSGIIVTIRGQQLNGSGDSKLRGLDGFQQALLKVISRSKPGQMARICGAYSALMKDDCQSLGEEAGYSIVAKKLASNPVATKKYRMALIFKKRGKPDKTRLLFDKILKTYPNSLEAAYVQMHLMRDDLKEYRQKKRYNDSLLRSVLSINSAYRSSTMYHQLKSDTLKWITELVVNAKQKSVFDERIYQGVLFYSKNNVDTRLLKHLKSLTIGWLIQLGELELGKKQREDRARLFFNKAEALGISDAEAKTLNDKIKAAKILSMIRKGQRDEAEMALVEWEVEEPDSAILMTLKKEFDRPSNMVTIPAGKVRHRWVESFNLDIYEVTNGDFLEFVKANPSYRKSAIRSDGSHSKNDADYLKRWRGDLRFPEKLRDIPVVFVSQIIASAYCAWKVKRLPTNLEWGLAAGEGKRNYPWGDQAPTPKHANFKKGIMGDPLPGNSRPLGATPEGVMHMAGNVWEFTSTIKKNKAIARGGSYYDYADILHNDNVNLTGDSPTYSSRFSGFRCAK